MNNDNQIDMGQAFEQRTHKNRSFCLGSTCYSVLKVHKSLNKFSGIYHNFTFSYDCEIGDMEVYLKMEDHFVVFL